MIADIAAIFHWPLSELEEFETEDLIRWHKLAVERAKQLSKFRL